MKPLNKNFIGKPCRTYLRQMVLSWLYFLANAIRDGSMIPPLSLRTKCRVDSVISYQLNYSLSRIVLKVKNQTQYQPTAAMRNAFTSCFSIYRAEKRYMKKIKIKIKTFLNVVISKSSPIFKLLSGKNQTLLIWRNSWTRKKNSKKHNGSAHNWLNFKRKNRKKTWKNIYLPYLESWP